MATKRHTRITPTPTDYMKLCLDVEVNQGDCFIHEGRLYVAGEESCVQIGGKDFFSFDERTVVPVDVEIKWTERS